MTQTPLMSLSPSRYVSAQNGGRELERIFQTHWIGVGRSDQVAEPGSFQTLDIAGHALILLRDRAGVLRAFVNSCRHRGARLMEGSGQCRGIKCPFHAWAYRLDGQLVAAPSMEEADGFRREDYALIALVAEERLGFAFVRLIADGPDLDETLGDFAEVHAPWPLETLVTTRRRRFSVNCNWKAFLEVFNEYYHLPFVHPTTVDALYARPDPAHDATGAFASQFGTTQGTGGLLQDQQAMALPEIAGLRGEARKGVRYTWVFPNMTFAAGRDALWVYEAYPAGPDRCDVVQSACFAPETLALKDAGARIAFYHNRLDAAIDEDIPALENQHLGLSSPGAQAGPLHPLLEANVGAFARWYRTQMADGQDSQRV